MFCFKCEKYYRVLFFLLYFHDSKSRSSRKSRRDTYYAHVQITTLK